MASAVPSADTSAMMARSLWRASPTANSPRLRDGRLKLLPQDLFGESADDAVNLLAVAEDDEGRNAHDAVPSRRLRVLVGVELVHLQAIAHLRGHFFKDRRQPAARTAPGRPKVHDHGRLAFEHLLVKLRVGQVHHRGHCNNLPIGWSTPVPGGGPQEWSSTQDPSRASPLPL